jgi:iron-sulfur cluster repair protein YtfE (RIC family)
VTSSISADGIERQFVEHEHRRLRAGLATLRDTIDEAHRLMRPETVDGVARTLTWLRHDLLPHAAWEEAWLYPHIDTEAGTPWATRALHFEHEQIREVAWEVETAFEAVEDQWSLAHAFRIAIALARLEALVSAHLAQEERFVLPLLEAEGPVAAL